MLIQVTVLHKDNKYKPMSTLLDVENMQYYEEHKATLQKKALENIGHYRHLTPSEIVKRGYTRVKVREYDQEKIKAQQEFQHKVNLLKYIDKKRKENKQNT